MKSNTPRKFLNIFFYVLVIVTCCMALSFLYKNYKKEQEAQATFEKLRKDILVEIDIIYQNQVYFETNHWRKFYTSLCDSLGNKKHYLSKEEFQNYVNNMTLFTERDFYFKSFHWEKAKLHPEFIKRLTPYQLYRLHEFYDYQEKKSAIYYDKVNEVLAALFFNRQDQTLFEYHYKHHGNFLQNAFLLDVGRANILMYAESVYSAFEVTEPEHFKKLKENFFTSMDGTKGIVRDSIN